VNDVNDVDDMYTELLNIRGSLEAVLNRVDNLIDDILDEDDETLDAIEVPSLTGEYEDTFSEEKEGFMAP
jgi:hypothetical protein|tara:strand:- start:139 stop:348 length:210 start_codon:yes stop_codon:yes gene_type:complete